MNQCGKYVLFGPPCVGKTNLLRHLGRQKRVTISAIHLEELGSRSDRILLLKTLAQVNFELPLFVTAADLRRDQIPAEFGVISLIPKDRAAYLQQVQEVQHREKRPPQNEAMVYDGMSKLQKGLFIAEFDSLPPVNLETLAREILSSMGI